jgi:hypothetical protein
MAKGKEKREQNKWKHYKQTLITNISSVFQTDINSEQETMDSSVYMFMAKPFMKVVLDAHFTKKDLSLAVPNITMW